MYKKKRSQIFFLTVLLLAASVFSIVIYRISSLPTAALSQLVKLPDKAELQSIRLIAGPAAVTENDMSLPAADGTASDTSRLMPSDKYAFRDLTEGELFEEYRKLFETQSFPIETPDASGWMIPGPAWYYRDAARLIYFFDIGDEKRLFYVRLIFYEPFRSYPDEPAYGDDPPHIFIDAGTAYLLSGEHDDNPVYFFEDSYENFTMLNCDVIGPPSGPMCLQEVNRLAETGA